MQVLKGQSIRRVEEGGGGQNEIQGPNFGLEGDIFSSMIKLSKSSENDSENQKWAKYYHKGKTY